MTQTRRSRSRSSQIDELTRVLHHLELSRQQILSALTTLRASSVSSPSFPSRCSPSPERLPSPRATPLRSHSNICLGDQVRIRNPTGRQQSTGSIIGVTPSNFFQVRTPNGDVILRISSNLIFISSDSS